jgi:hypothetical protein
VIKLFKQYRKKKPIDEERDFGFTECNDAKLSNAVHVIVTFLSSFLVTGPIFALYFIQDMFLRLGMVMLSTTVFSVR